MILARPTLIFRLLIASVLVAAALPGQVDSLDFNRDVRPILAGRCFTCHGFDPAARKGGAKGSGGLRLDTREGALADLGDGTAAIVPGDPDRSVLLKRITASDGARRMPPPAKGAALTSAEVATLRRWIAGGAQYAEHWAFVAPRPAAGGDGQAPAIEGFLAAHWSAHQLVPNPPADRATLLRRVCLDLTGLPPTDAQRDAFLADTEPGAYERLVDRLLASPAYGEHFARPWLDLARYADSAGYASDPKRDIWAYRDWVVRAFNRNLPFDQFTVEQLAGDLLPDATDEQRIATAFHRNTMTNTEGGTDDEEFRNVAVVDRVSTTMATWMGTTMACAQCHDHKYDPLTQKEFFQLFAFFNTTQDSDRGDERPRMEVFDAQTRRRRAALLARQAVLRKELEAEGPAFDAAFAAWDRAFPRGTDWHAIDGVAKSGGVSWTLDAGRWDALRIARRGAAAAPAGGRLTVTRRGTGPTVARFVRIRLPGRRKILSLAEVQVFVDGVNVAPKGRARQSSNGSGGVASRAIDGRTDGDYERGSVTHTAQSRDPWWELDLGAGRDVERLVIWNRTGNAGLRDRIRGARVELLDAQRRVVWSRRRWAVPDPQTSLDVTAGDELDIAQSWNEGKATVLLLKRTLHDPGARIHVTAGKGDDDLVLAAAAMPLVRPYQDLPAELFAALRRGPKRRSAAETAALRAAYRQRAPMFAGVRARLAKIEPQLAALRPRTSVPVMVEQPAGQRRETRVQVRGNFQALGETVTPDVPKVFPPLPPGAPRNRLGLARWLVSADNPLTARVVVNRFWELLFGTGLVATSDDFGTRGSLPSHPALLDDLAARFVASGWDVKALIRRIVTSRAYRRASSATPTQLRKDPGNLWLARGPRVRLSAEMIRDVALQLSGLLSRKMFGPPVRPPRPNLGLRAAFGGSTDWQDSRGEDRYRRGLYTFWQRSLPYPSMAAFDAPSREVCTVKRQPTNTPLQALVTLNDPVYVEAAQAFARTIAAHPGPSPRERAAFALRRCVVRAPRAAEIDRVTALYETAWARYRRDAAAAKALATVPLGPAPDGADLASLAAWTVVANVLLNLDEVLVKR